ncbi:DUF5977 domain-containing protein [Niabella sp.]|uniref:DUF5977 domain-containing protein n=1 Tax=Niabella sp. TaxID=1962976 RepID=UPI002615D2EA|nr:DUF5977 domain-containing protein [Niabella sp.]
MGLLGLENLGAGELWNLTLSNSSNLAPIPKEYVFDYHTIQYFVGTNRLISTKRTEYSNDAQITSVKIFVYDNEEHLQPTRVITTTSKGDSSITDYRYPHDFVGQQPYTDMVNRHIWSPIIEQLNYRKLPGGQSFFLNSTKTSYDYWNGLSLILPQSITNKQKDINGTPDNRVQFNKYDNYGNLLEQQKTNSIKEVYFWGYKGQYPVAKVVGSKGFNQVLAESGIDTALLNEPGSASALRGYLSALRNVEGVQVNTYTYLPLIGITSETDPANRTIYYEYDDLGRLALVKDDAGKVIRNYQYAYRQYPSGIINTSPDWHATGVSRCVVGINDQNTGEQELEQRDINMSSASYNQTRWISNGQNLSFCPLPTIFYNTERSQYFTRSNCPTGYSGGSENYIVPAKKYSSSVDQADADQKAQDEINANGQSYANTNAGCYAVCSFVSGSPGKYQIISDQVHDQGTQINFSISFSTSSQYVYWDESNTIAVLNGACKPAATRTLNVTSNGTNWSVRISATGELTVRAVGGTIPTTGDVIELNGITYQK